MSKTCFTAACTSDCVNECNAKVGCAINANPSGDELC